MKKNNKKLLIKKIKKLKKIVKNISIYVFFVL